MKILFLILLISVGALADTGHIFTLKGANVPYFTQQMYSRGQMIKSRAPGWLKVGTTYKVIAIKPMKGGRAKVQIQIISEPRIGSKIKGKKIWVIFGGDKLKYIKRMWKPKSTRRRVVTPPRRMKTSTSSSSSKVYTLKRDTKFYMSPRISPSNHGGTFIGSLEYIKVSPKTGCCIKIKVVAPPSSGRSNSKSVPGIEGWVKFDTPLDTAVQHTISSKRKIVRSTSAKTGCKTRPKVRQSIPEEPETTEETQGDDQEKESAPSVELTRSCNALRVFKGKSFTEGQQKVLQSCYQDLRRKVLRGASKNYHKIFKNIYLLPPEERDFFISLVTALGEAGNMGDNPPVEMMNVMLTLRNRVFYQKAGQHIIWIKQKKRMIKSLSRNPLKAKLRIRPLKELKRAKQLIKELKKAGFHFRDLEEFVRNDGVKKLEKAFRGNIKYTLKPFYKYGLDKKEDLKKLLKLLTKLGVSTRHNEEMRERKEKIDTYQSTQKSDNKTTIFDVAMQDGQYDANRETNSQWKGVLFNNWKGKFKIKKGEVIKAIDAFSRLNEVEKGITTTDPRRYVTHYYSPFYVGTPNFLKSRNSKRKLVSDRSRIRESVVDMRYDGYPYSAHDSSKGEFNCSLPKEDRRQPEDISSGHCFYRVEQIRLGSPHHDWVKYKSLRKD